jgi:gamma-glutamyltranspeptidase/glutathione hydrolase
VSGVQPPIGRSCGRSLTISQQGIVAASQTLAAQAGAQILARGGSAADAAIAVNAVLGVIEPMMNGIGGDLFVLYREAGAGKLAGLNASGPAPRGLTPDLLGSQATMPVTGIHTVTVPGAVDGWAKIHSRYGKLPWKSLFDPAIAYAEQGFPVPEIVAALWSTPDTLCRLRSSAEAARVYLPGDRPPATGEVFRNAELAATYRLLADEGPRALYEGPVAAAIVQSSRRLGGVLTAEDLASYSSEWAEPISIDYRGWRIFELPPNGQGMAALEMLNIMAEIPANPDGPFSAAEMHRRIEAMKLAYADVYRYNADPRCSRIPLDTLLSRDYARERAALIDFAAANPAAGAGDVPCSDTVYFTVADREGNIASWIQSIFSSFGSAIVVEGKGFVLQNRGAGFSLDPGHPNVLAGGKRPFHTTIPGIMERGDLHAGFGIMGGANQPLAHAQFVSNVVDYGMTLQEAMEAPRFFKGGPSGCDVAIESRMPVTTLQELSRMGHQITLRAAYSQEMGRGQAILHNSATRTNFAASDPRADGAAVPEPICP